MNQQTLSAFIWSVADLLRGDYKQSDYGKVILPFTVLRRLDCVLEDIPDGPAAQAAKDELAALTLFKRDLGTFVRVYAFLGQVFDYGNTAIEKRALFFKRLLPLLDFGREREGVDLSKVALTHHRLKEQGPRSLALQDTDVDYKLQPLLDSGGGGVQDKQKVLLSEIVAKVNDLFDGELSDDDRLVYVNHVKGKLLESDILVQQASNKGQFDNSPDLDSALTDAIIDAFDAYTSMSKQALDSERVRSGLKAILLEPAQLYEALRARGTYQPLDRAP